MTRSEVFTNIILPYLEMEIEEFEFLGQGWSAVAYKSGDRVYKITDDESDFNVANELMNEEFTYFAKVYDAMVIDINDEFPPYYFICTEYLQLITEHQYFDTIKPIVKFEDKRPSFITEAQRLGFSEHNDFHMQNIGIDMYGRWKIFDFGENTLTSNKPINRIIL